MSQHTVPQWEGVDEGIAVGEQGKNFPQMGAVGDIGRIENSFLGVGLSHDIVLSAVGIAPFYAGADKMFTKRGYISDKKFQFGNKIVCGYYIPNITNTLKLFTKNSQLTY